MHPDDRLWRHPSELSWERSQAAERAAGAPPPVAGLPPAGPGSPGAARLLLVTVTSGVFGAAMALGVLAVNGALETGGTERIVERVGVRDMLADPLASQPDLGLADVVAAASPSVVGVEAVVDGGDAAGSGIVLLDDGHIVTAAALVSGATEVQVVLPDGTEVVAEVVAVDEITDVAVLLASVPADHHRWQPAVRGGASSMRVGDATVAIGTADRPGADPTVALGLVSAVDQMARSSAGWTLTGLIETDMSLDARVLGGALVDRAGRVVGMITGVGDPSERVGLTTPIDRAWNAMEAALDGEDAVVWLGIEGSDQELPTTSLAQIVASRAVEVHTVVPDSPAATAGISSGDLVVSVNGEAIDSMGDLVVELRGHEPGDHVDVGILRDGDEVSVGVTLGATEDD
jgi:S1-C subfamily serine protease